VQVQIGRRMIDAVGNDVKSLAAPSVQENEFFVAQPTHHVEVDHSCD